MAVVLPIENFLKSVPDSKAPKVNLIKWLIRLVLWKIASASPGLGSQGANPQWIDPLESFGLVLQPKDAIAELRLWLWDWRSEIHNLWAQANYFQLNFPQWNPHFFPCVSSCAVRRNESFLKKLQLDQVLFLFSRSNFKLCSNEG